MLTKADLKHGMRVRVEGDTPSQWNGQCGAVEKINPKNVQVKLDSGVMLNTFPGFLVAEDAPAPAPNVTVTVESIPLAPAVGAVVTVDDPRCPGAHVFLGEGTASGRLIFKVVKLGGDGNRYWRMTPSKVTVVKDFKLELV